MDRAVASVVIPAHNEGTVIGRCLDVLGRAEVAADLEVVVSANGCDDDTVAVAESYRDRLPRLRVLDLDEAGKAHALNAADAQASAYPRIYLDADIELSPDAVDALVAALSTERALVAAPSIAFDVSQASGPVRAFHRAWARTDYLTNHLVGLGVYALSEAGRARFGEFPDLLADDLLVAEHFDTHERLTTAGTFTVSTPRDLASLLKVRTRSMRGNRQVREHDDTPHRVDGSDSSTARVLLDSWRHGPLRAADLFWYVAVTLVARWRARGDAGPTWHRDDSSRSTPAVAPGATEPTDSVAYLVSQYPAPSHVFIEREILGLESLGYRVHPVTVRELPADQALTSVMSSERARTLTLQRRSVGSVRSLAAELGRSPRATAGALGVALRTGQRTARSRVWQVFYLAEAALLVRHMRRSGLRHVHAHFANNGADIARAAVELARRADGPDAGWRWSFTMHGPTEFSDVGHYDLAAKVESASAVACISDFARGRLMQLVDEEHWSKLEIVRMSVELESYPYAEPRPDTSAEFRVLFVGRLVPEKGPELLLEALRDLRDRGVPVLGRFVGGGELHDALVRRRDELGLADRVEILGAVGQDLMPSQFAWADAFCLPSFHEGLPVVLMEALASGTPTLTTTIAGIPELVVDGSTGILVPPGRSDLVGEGLERLHGSPTLRATLARQGRERVEQEFASERVRVAQRDFLRSVTP